MKQNITHLAIKNKQTVLKQCHIEETERKKQRQKVMKQCYLRRTARRKKEAKVKEYLSHQHLIKTPTELKEALKEIDMCTNSTASKRKKDKCTLLQVQINIRKVLKQNIKITLSHKGKQRPLTDVIQNLTDFLKDHPPSSEDTNESKAAISDPFALVGKEVLHKFTLDSGEDQWFRGMVFQFKNT